MNSRKRIARTLSCGLALSAMFYSPTTPSSAVAAPEHKHDHKDGKPDEHKGEKKDVGTVELEGWKIKVTQFGDVKAGQEVVFVLNLAGGKGEPKAIRAWIGLEKPGEGGKEKAEEEQEGEWHAHLDAPDKLPERSLLWLEVQTDAGRKATSIAFK